MQSPVVYGGLCKDYPRKFRSTKSLSLWAFFDGTLWWHRCWVRVIIRESAVGSIKVLDHYDEDKDLSAAIELYSTSVLCNPQMGWFLFSMSNHFGSYDRSVTNIYKVQVGKEEIRVQFQMLTAHYTNNNEQISWHDNHTGEKKP